MIETDRKIVSALVRVRQQLAHAAARFSPQAIPGPYAGLAHEQIMADAVIVSRLAQSYCEHPSDERDTDHNYRCGLCGGDVRYLAAQPA